MIQDSSSSRTRTTADTNLDAWCRPVRRVLDAPLQVFCLPHAGGAASNYRTWGTELGQQCEVIAIELPGRGTRLAEPPRTRIHQIVDELAEAVRRTADRPFVLFGHSLGGLVAFETTRALARTGGPIPKRLLISASPAPHLDPAGPTLHDLDRPALIRTLRQMKSTPPEILDNDELLDIVLPYVRSDFEILETYRYAPEASPLECTITVFGGSHDSLVEPGALEAWAQHTNAGFSLLTLPGDHFFPADPRSGFFPVLSGQLAEVSGG